MPRTPTLTATLIAIAQCGAQPFAEGDINTAYFDSTRSRNVTCAIHYPATSSGNGAPVAAGAFPVIVLGHGFVMGVDAYAYFHEHFVPAGYIVVLPTTESGFAPDHADFGADIAFLANALQDANTDSLSPFFDHVLPATAIGGHSMGGGAATLGASSNANIQAALLMAPAETGPSAIAAAGAIQVPTLVFAASEDCVTPITDHAQPIYDALSVPCRALVNITGGGHCYFGDPNFNCSFGEFTCGPSLMITRAEQQDVVTDIATLWLDHFLMGNAASYPTLLDSLSGSQRFTALTTCVPTALANVHQNVAPTVTIVDGALSIQGFTGPVALRVMDATGRLIIEGPVVKAGTSIDLESLVAGQLLVVELEQGAERWVRTIIAR